MIGPNEPIFRPPAPVRRHQTLPGLMLHPTTPHLHAPPSSPPAHSCRWPSVLVLPPHPPSTAPGGDPSQLAGKLSPPFLPFLDCSRPNPSQGPKFLLSTVPNPSGNCLGWIRSLGLRSANPPDPSVFRFGSDFRQRRVEILTLTFSYSWIAADLLHKLLPGGLSATELRRDFGSSRPHKFLVGVVLHASL
jgi:hypothetical protein